MTQITTHILDTSTGRPAAGVTVTISVFQDGVWQLLAQKSTNDDGRTGPMIQDGTSGIYKLHFETGAYFEQTGRSGFYPYVDLIFTTSNEPHYHVPLLLNPYGYSTYRGS